jgi:hypothetical protein
MTRKIEREATEKNRGSEGQDKNAVELRRNMGASGYGVGEWVPKGPKGTHGSLSEQRRLLSKCGKLLSFSAFPETFPDLSPRRARPARSHVLTVRPFQSRNSRNVNPG